MGSMVLVCVSVLACLAAASLKTSATATAVPVFIVRSHLRSGGKPQYDGIYIYKNNETRRLLETGTAVAVSEEPHVTAYLAGKDGIYFYDDETEKLEKYGTIEDIIMSIDKATNSNDLYILTQDQTVYKVTEEGTKKTEIAIAKGAHQIILDNNDNLFYLKEDLYVISDGVKKVEGLPITGRMFLYKARFVDNGIMSVSDKGLYHVKADGTSSVYVPGVEEKAQMESYGHQVEYILDSIEKL